MEGDGGQRMSQAGQGKRAPPAARTFCRAEKGLAAPPGQGQLFASVLGVPSQGLSRSACPLPPPSPLAPLDCPWGRKLLILPG